MAAWTSDELNQIGKADELEISSLRQDGTLRKAVTIWVVRVGDALYVRSYRGQAGAWYRGTLLRHAGHIRAGGLEKDVSFAEETDTEINSQIDAAYRSKYSRHGAQYVDPMVGSGAKATTLKLLAK